MSEHSTYINWLKRLPANDVEYAHCACPACGAVGLSYQYFGFADGEFGWKLVWCTSCMAGIRISRTRIPSSAKPLVGEDDQMQFLERHVDINLIA